MLVIVPDPQLQFSYRVQSLPHQSKGTNVSLAFSFQYGWHFLKLHPLPYTMLDPKRRRETRTLTSYFLLCPLIFPDWKGKLSLLLFTSYLPSTQGQQNPWLNLHRQNSNLLNTSLKNWMLWAIQIRFLIVHRYLEKPLPLVYWAHHFNKWEAPKISRFTIDGNTSE